MPLDVVQELPALFVMKLVEIKRQRELQKMSLLLVGARYAFNASSDDFIKFIEGLK